MAKKNDDISKAVTTAAKAGATAAAVAAQLSLDITAFNAVTSTKYCAATLSLINDGGGLVSVSGDQISVTGKVDFAISITSSIGVYIPVGIALVQVSNPTGSGNPNDPQGYTNWPGFHSWIDGGLISKAGIKFAGLAPRVVSAQPISLLARPDGRDPMFVAVMDYLLAQNQQVEPLYQLEKNGKLSDQLEKTGKFHQDPNPVEAEGRAFLEGQLLKGGAMLAAIWTTAWHDAVPDTFLRSQLVRRQAAGNPPKDPK